MKYGAKAEMEKEHTFKRWSRKPTIRVTGVLQRREWGRNDQRSQARTCPPAETWVLGWKDSLSIQPNAWQEDPEQHVFQWEFAVPHTKLITETSGETHWGRGRGFRCCIGTTWASQKRSENQEPGRLWKCWVRTTHTLEFWPHPGYSLYEVRDDVFSHIKIKNN